MAVKKLTLLLSVFILLFTTYNLKITTLKNRYFIRNLIITFIVTGILTLKSDFWGIVTFLIITSFLFYNENKFLLKNSISLTISVIIFLLADTIQGIIFTVFLKKDIITIVNSPLILIACHLILFFICFLISSCISVVLKKLRFDLIQNNIKSKIYYILLSYQILTIIILYTILLITKISSLNNTTIYLDCIVFSAYFFCTLLINYLLTMIVDKEMLLKNMQEYTSNLENMYNDIRKFKHDHINILSSINGYIYENDINGLEKFFNKNILHMTDNITKINCKLELLQYIKIIELKGLLSSKVIQARELDVYVYIDIVENIESINMDIVDLCRALGILLDNAIEGSLLCEKPYIKIGFINKSNSILILIINSCLNDNPPIYKMFEKGFSTKGTNRGIGLNNLKEILKNYNNITLDTSIKDKEFIQNLQIET